MRDGHLDAVVLGQRAQTAVAQLRLQQRGQLQRVEHRSSRLDALVGEEAEIEADVLPHDRSLADEVLHFEAQSVEVQSVADVGVADAGDLLNPQRDRTLGIDERLEAVAHAVEREAHHPDLGDAILPNVKAGGFQVDRHEAAWHGWSLLGAPHTRGSSLGVADRSQPARAAAL